MIHAVNVISDTNIGGAGKMLLTFLRNYDRDSFKISVILPAGSLLCAELDALGIPFHVANGLAERSLSLSGAAELTRLLRRIKPDIVHTHASMSARVAARFTSAKIVYTRHSVFPNRACLTAFPGKQIAGLINNTLADAIIAVSPAAADNIVETGVNPDKITVIYNGVDPAPPLQPDEKREIRAAYGVEDHDFACGIFARLTPVKGHDYILDAARALLCESRAKILIAGTGESESELRTRAEKEGLTNVIFTGFVCDAARLIAAMDIQLNASYGTEATSLALLEGMSAGVPAVVSSFGGNPYVIHDGVNGFVVPQRDGSALADAVRRLENDETLRQRMSAAAAAMYKERFTAAIMTGNIEKLYANLQRKSR